MRILFVSNFYPPYELGGYGQWCQEVAYQLRQRNHDVRIITSRHGVKPGKNGHFSNGDYIIRSLYLQTDIDYYDPLDFFLNRRRKDKENVYQISAIIKEFNPDIVLVWGMWNLSLMVPYMAEQLLPGRVAYFLASYWPLDENPHEAYWSLSANSTLGKAVKQPLRWLALTQLEREKYPPPLLFEHVVCCSHYVRNTLVEAHKLPQHTRVLLGGIDPQPFLSVQPTLQQTPKQTLRLLYFGRLIHDKGVHTAVEALGHLKQKGLAEKVELTILGNGRADYKQHLQQLAEDLNVANQIHFADWVERSRIPNWLKQFDVYLFTSIWPEPMARSVMEAMAAGLLVVGSEVGGQTEMLNSGENSLTFAAEDSQTLAANIALVLKDPVLRVRLAQAGQEMVLKQFTLDRMVNDVEDYLANIVSNN